MQMRGEPSCFSTTTMGKLQGDSDSEMIPLFNLSSVKSLIFSWSAGEYLHSGILIGGCEPVSIVKGWSFVGILTGRSRLEQNFFNQRKVRFLKYRNLVRSFSNTLPLFDSEGSSRSSASSSLLILSNRSGGRGWCLGFRSLSRDSCRIGSVLLVHGCTPAPIV
jgi:hypothetical protein